jgi:hypothetical protein
MEFSSSAFATGLGRWIFLNTMSRFGKFAWNFDGTAGSIQTFHVATALDSVADP